MARTELKRINDYTWEIPKRGKMRVPGRIYADAQLIKKIEADNAVDQVANVACLPGIVGYSLAMPDAHWGYGFPIGGVAATDPDNDGVISPGGVGYDINCGVRLMTTALDYQGVRDRIRDIVTGLYRDIPCGVGSSGAIPKLSTKDMKRVLSDGASCVVEQGYGNQEDLAHTEEHGRLNGADPDVVSERAKSRGEEQLGTLGSGNHFLEVGVVDRIENAEIARAYGLREGQVTLMIHSGSRGLGYQVCDDSLQTMVRAAARYGIDLPDRQLCCAPVKSQAGRDYLAAMAAAANYAWANRQVMMHLARMSLEGTLGASAEALDIRLVYDVCHNIAKFEIHEVEGQRRRLCVHRKGATRAFPGNREEVPEAYRRVGQPVLVPGDMGTGSWVCAGTDEAMTETFGSACHGAGRVKSRTSARKGEDAAALLRELEQQGIFVMARSKKTVTEESPSAYKDIDAVTAVLDTAGISRRVARIRPVGVVKG
ncbi:MAG TPA: RtcB family protein [Candidatus Hydrogenedentes bacterium]|nr:RtcB family protein [Candidatus Hydrogenedentota bacterium]